MFITASATVVSSVLDGTRFSGWQWAPWVLGLTLILVFTAISMNSGGGLRGRRGMSGISGLNGRGRAAGDRLDGTVAHRWHGLVMVSRIMPGPAGRRWLAEAESVLWEMAATQRTTAIRSYVVSGPRLAAMMWAYEGLRRVRPGPRHPR
ncbi:MAG: hypothetical protein ACRDOB_07165 [Streptosporangiaceae bacterium]